MHINYHQNGYHAPLIQEILSNWVNLNASKITSAIVLAYHGW